LMELQTAVIDKLSLFAGKRPIKTTNQDEVILHPKVEEWMP